MAAVRGAIGIVGALAAWLLWASLNTDGLMTASERQATIKELLSLQRSDGGWSTSALKPMMGYKRTGFKDPGALKIREAAQRWGLPFAHIRED